MFDEHIVLEHADLHAVVLRPHQHLAVNGFATGLELAFGDNGATATEVAVVATAGALGGKTG